MNYFIYIIAFISFLEAQQEILLDRVASVVENKIVLMSDVVLAANAVAAQQQINFRNLTRKHGGTIINY
jgi:peptidyl-prolyl cis-trans isomerase SurA